MTKNRKGNMSTAVITDWMKDIQKVARRASLDWPGIVDQEDMVQDVCLHILEAPGTVRDLAEMDDNARYQTLHKIAHRIASRERASYEYFSGQFRYSAREVRAALEAGALRKPGSRLKSTWSAEDYVANGSDHSDTVIGMVSMEQDLQAALVKLKDTNGDYHEILSRRYVDGETGMDQVDRKRLERAVGSLTTKMNHAHKAPGGRPYDRAKEVCIPPVDDPEKYVDWRDSRVVYEADLSEIHDPKPELVSAHADGLGACDVKKELYPWDDRSLYP